MENCYNNGEKSPPHVKQLEWCGLWKGWMDGIGIEIGFIQYSKLHEREGRKKPSCHPEKW